MRGKRDANMSEASKQSPWWDLHLRKARGETLSAVEQACHDSEINRQDREALPLRTDLESLKAMRDQVTALSEANAELRDRIANLARQIRDTEQALDERTRTALGVGI